MSKRRNGECSIFPYRNGYAAYAWVTTPDGERKRKWVYGKTHDEVHAKWIKLQSTAAEGPVPTSVPSVSHYMNYWLREVIKPNLAPKTFEKYETFTRLHILPYLGAKRLDKLQVKDIRQWLNKLAQVCQCCAQGKDAARPEPKRRCCAIGQCCHAPLSARSRADARDTLRAAYTCAVEEELITRNPAAVVRLPAPRSRKRRSWTVDEARRFLESTRRHDEPLYAAFVLILVLGLRKGEVLGLTWDLADLDTAELYVSEQVQRVGRELLRRQVKTETSEAPLPLPELCVAALKIRAEQQQVTVTATAPTVPGLIPAWCSPPDMAPPSSRGTSAAASTAASPRPRCRGSPSTAPGRPAGHCWPPSTFTLAWPCRFCGTARSRSRWRSTPRFPRPPPETHSASSASGWTASTVAVLQCCTDSRTASS